ncbi:MAG: hypothetical protein JWL60_2249 [Gemmatimonadetes bacterium]|jgi:hypothetical protein|nr:hypothetical protein [Gemmatimonadota bacterium]
MSDKDRSTLSPDSEGTRPTTSRDDALQVDDGPLKQEGDALRDGSGSRHGQSPPNVDRAEQG